MPHAAMLKTAAAIVVVGPRSTDRASCRLDTDRKTCISEQKNAATQFCGPREVDNRHGYRKFCLHVCGRSEGMSVA